MGAARPLPPRADIGPGGQSVGQAARFCLARASTNLDLPNRIVGAVVGLSEPTISRLKNGNYTLKRNEKEFELSLLFVRLYRSLIAIVGGDDVVAAVWLRSPNIALHARPIERIQTVDGLRQTIDYLDARRAD